MRQTQYCTNLKLRLLCKRGQSFEKHEELKRTLRPQKTHSVAWVWTRNSSATGTKKSTMPNSLERVVPGCLKRVLPGSLKEKKSLVLWKVYSHGSLGKLTGNYHEYTTWTNGANEAKCNKYNCAHYCWRTRPSKRHTHNYGASFAVVTPRHKENNSTDTKQKVNPKP